MCDGFGGLWHGQGGARVLSLAGSLAWLCAWLSLMPGLPSLQLWAISSGDLLLSVLFDVGITSVTMDLAEHHVFCGGSDGSIFQVDLCSWVSGHWGLREHMVGAPHPRH